MKRARDWDEIDPWQERCYLGDVEHLNAFLLVKEMCEKHKTQRTHAIATFECGVFYVLYTALASYPTTFGITPRRCYDWEDVINFVQQRVERGSIPFDRSESSLFCPRAIENRTRAVVAWIMCGKRLGLPRDVVRLIGCMVRQSELKEWI